MLQTISPGAHGDRPDRASDATRTSTATFVHHESAIHDTVPVGISARCRAHVAKVGNQMRRCGDAGLATAEYAIATIAAAGFAGLLIVVLKSDSVRGLLEGIIKSALSV
ncbi:DUF4244 domain-containing protein [Rarobacter incanus]|uniref:Uncharacterized protein DUF4244 n=1 Tax=Rarobacter incanus TaxID=153494 RepID=A0A542SP57_9MICO|nr:DUF4244 domain-containing protein [Rarobacter incanus]TQK76414.1 uncharacterized protein DUF4244 [Rarobacter incanus]